MPTLSGQFSTIQIADAAGTLQEISQYVTSVSPTMTPADTDLTSFATGGGMVTENHRRGATMNEITMKGLFDPTFVKILRQIVGARSGVQFIFKAGSNAAPTYGDETFTGTYTIMGLNFTYNTGAPATIDVDLKPADGSTTAPAFGKL